MHSLEKLKHVSLARSPATAASALPTFSVVVARNHSLMFLLKSQRASQAPSAPTAPPIRSWQRQQSAGSELLAMWASTSMYMSQQYAHRPKPTASPSSSHPWPRAGTQRNPQAYRPLAQQTHLQSTPNPHLQTYRQLSHNKTPTPSSPNNQYPQPLKLTGRQVGRIILARRAAPTLFSLFGTARRLAGAVVQAPPLPRLRSSDG